MFDLLLVLATYYLYYVLRGPLSMMKRAPSSRGGTTKRDSDDAGLLKQRHERLWQSHRLLLAILFGCVVEVFKNAHKATTAAIAASRNINYVPPMPISEHIENEGSIMHTEQADASSIPNATTENRGEGMAACLLVLEDTIRLKEWLAYHYSVLPLSRLIIALDPFTSDRSIRRIMSLADYYNELGDANVTIWFDDEFVTNNRIRDRLSLDGDRKELHKNHKVRQIFFVSECMKEHKRNGANWVILTDTDEILTFNYISKDENRTRYDGILKWKKRNAILKERTFARRIRRQLPPIQNSTIGSFLKMLRVTNQYNPKCIRIPGIGFPGTNGGISDIKHLLSKETRASGIELDKLMTLAHRGHERRNGDFSKVMIDVSHVSFADLHTDYAHTIHNPNLMACGWNGKHASGQDYIAAIFRLHHHLGTFRSFIERDSERRSNIKTLFGIKKNKWKVVGTDNAVIPWIDKFVQKVGPEMAAELLGEFNDTALEDEYYVYDYDDNSGADNVGQDQNKHVDQKEPNENRPGSSQNDEKKGEDVHSIQGLSVDEKEAQSESKDAPPKNSRIKAVVDENDAKLGSEDAALNKRKDSKANVDENKDLKDLRPNQRKDSKAKVDENKAQFKSKDANLSKRKNSKAKVDENKLEFDLKDAKLNKRKNSKAKVDKNKANFKSKDRTPNQRKDSSGR